MASLKLSATELREDFLTCSICLQHFQDPRALSCLHTFCFECLVTYAETTRVSGPGGHLTCPTCKTLTVIPTDGISGILKNHYINSLLDRTREETQPKSCDMCIRETATSVVLCLECNCNLCQFCQEYHRQQKKTSEHRLLSEADIKSGKYEEERKTTAPMCKEHPDNKMDMFCTGNGCMKLICIRCKLLDHLDHPTVTLEKHSSEKRLELTELCKKISNYEQVQKEQLQEGIKYKETICKTTEVQKRKVRATVKEIITFIEDEGESFIADLDKSAKQTTEKMTSYLRAIEDDVQKYKHIRVFGEELLKYSTQADIIEMAPQAIYRGNQMLTKKLETPEWTKWHALLFKPRDIKSSCQQLRDTIGSLHPDGEGQEPENYWWHRGLGILICHGDISKVTADVIVRPVDEMLMPVGEESCAITEAAGPKMVLECQNYMSTHPKKLPQVGNAMATSGGNLSKYMIHVNCPQYESYYRDASFKADVMSILKDILECADGLEATVVAIPAIGAGSTSVAKRIVASAFFEATRKFDWEFHPKYLESITFINNKTDICSHLKEMFETRKSSTKDKINFTKGESNAKKGNKGNQPRDATMEISLHEQLQLPGVKELGAYIIQYNIPDGIQSAEHPSPGKVYKGVHHKAYLPSNDEGKEILALLKKAFEARLIFKIGKEGSVIWNDIHHKTKIDGGPTKGGFPDPNYMKRIKTELAAKEIK